MDGDAKKIAFDALKDAWYKRDGLYSRYAKSVGLNYSTILVLQILFDSTGVYTQKEICEMLGLPKQYIHAIIKSFWEQGYVILKEAKDRRNKDILVTDKGIEYARTILSPLEKAESAALCGFSCDEIESHAVFTGKYVDSLETALNSLYS